MLVSVSIRKEDEDIWRKLPQKMEAIHKMLHGQKIAEVIVNEKPNIAEEASNILETVCTGHDHFRRNCGRKGCKF